VLGLPHVGDRRRPVIRRLPPVLLRIPGPGHRSPLVLERRTLMSLSCKVISLGTGRQRPFRRSARCDQMLLCRRKPLTGRRPDRTACSPRPQFLDPGTGSAETLPDHLPADLLRARRSYHPPSMLPRTDGRQTPQARRAYRT
jgi:hypothetical protein